MKKTWICAVVCGSLIAGVGFTYARWHPTRGVDYPFDSARYYSTTEVSYADSPSPYFYIDLASGGYIVHDPTRKDKSVLEQAQFKGILDAVLELLHLREKNLASFPQGLKGVILYNQRATENLHQARNVEEQLNKVVGHDDSEKDQAKFLNEVYRNATESASKSLQNSQARNETLMQAVNRSASAEGEMQAWQSNSDLQAIKHEAIMERNMLYSNLTSMIAAKNQVEADKEKRQHEAIQNTRLQFGFSDPYNRDAYEKRIFEPPKPLGLPDFK